MNKISNKLFVKLNVGNEVDFKRISAGNSIEIKSTCTNKTNVNVKILEA
jgi:hypothetical protein